MELSTFFSSICSEKGIWWPSYCHITIVIKASLSPGRQGGRGGDDPSGTSGWPSQVEHSECDEESLNDWPWWLTFGTNIIQPHNVFSWTAFFTAGRSKSPSLFSRHSISQALEISVSNRIAQHQEDAIVTFYISRFSHHLSYRRCDTCL